MSTEKSKEMIWLDEDFSCDRDAYGWKLHQWRDSVDKDGNKKRNDSISYYPTIRQMIVEILDRKSGECKDVAELKELLETAHLTILQKLEAMSIQ